MIRTFTEEVQLTASPSDWIDVSRIRRWAFYAADASGGVQVQQAKDSSGTGAKDITGATVTHSGAGIVEVDTQMLDLNNGFRYVKMTGATLFIAINPDGGPKVHSGVTAATVLATQS